MARVFFLSTVAILLVGCQAPPAPSGPTEMVLHIPDVEAFTDATMTVLREQGLPPERVDRVRGELVSEPTTSGQWFECWRGDSRGGYQAFESSIHTMRRIVTVRFEPVGGDAAGDEYRLTVNVEKERYSAPERQVTTASGALAIYNEKLPTTEGLRGAESRGAHWVPLGRDGLLEEYLLQKIAFRLPDVEPPVNADDVSESQPAAGEG